MNKYFKMLTQSSAAYDKVRGYTLHPGDEFELRLTRANLNELLRVSTALNRFYVVKVFRAAIWYDPRTWFKQFMRVRYEHYVYETEENLSDFPPTPEIRPIYPTKEETEDE